MACHLQHTIYGGMTYIQLLFLENEVKKVCQCRGKVVNYQKTLSKLPTLFTILLLTPTHHTEGSWKL